MAQLTTFERGKEDQVIVFLFFERQLVFRIAVRMLEKVARSVENIDRCIPGKAGVLNQPVPPRLSGTLVFDQICKDGVSCRRKSSYGKRLTIREEQLD